MLSVEELSQRHKAGETYEQIGSSVNLTGNAVRKRIRRYVKREPNLVKEYLGDPVNYERVTPSLPGSVRKIVAIGDIHANPDPLLLKQIIGLQPDHIMIGGDLLDSSEVSAHGLSVGEQRTHFRLEMRICRAFVATLKANTQAHIKIFRGNHDDWWHRKISTLIEEQLLFLVQDPLEMIIYGMPDVELISQPLFAKTPDGMTFPMGDMRHMAIVGDAFLSHANFTGKNPGMAVRKLYEWVQEWRKLMQWPDFGMYVQFHGHKIHYSSEQGGYVQLIEPGMGGTPCPEHYKVGYQAKWTPGATGALYFEQGEYETGWKTIRSSIKILQPHL